MHSGCPGFPTLSELLELSFGSFDYAVMVFGRKSRWTADEEQAVGETFEERCEEGGIVFGAYAVDDLVQDRGYHLGC